MFLDKVEQARGSIPSDRVGVLLVGHGQPDEWDVEWPTETEHEIGAADEHPRAARRERLRPRQARPGVDGVQAAAGRASGARNSLARGIDLLVYFSAGISAESIHSQYDVPKLMSEARRSPPRVAVVNLGAWNDHPLTIQAIAERVERMIRTPAETPAALASEA